MDDTQDYEYYESRAKDVKVEDITSSQDNADILAMLRDNDPYFKFFSIVTELEDGFEFVVREGDHLGWLGYFVGMSKQLESLCIEGFPENINYINEFFRELGRNQSIQTLQIGQDLGESFQSLIPFVRNNGSLHVLNFIGFQIGLQCARNIALLLDQQSSLKRLEFDGADIDDEGLLQIAADLKKELQIEELMFHQIGLGRDGCVALGAMLEGWRSPNLKTLILAYLWGIEDEGLHALAAGMKHCHNLTYLDLEGTESITEEGLRSLSTLFQSDNCRLEYLDLGGRMNMGNDGASALATGLASLPTLKRLNLRGTSIGDQGLQDLAEGLVNCDLEELDLSENMLTESVSGLRSLGALVRKTMSMKSLVLKHSSITDKGLQSFVEGMENCCSLTKLNLSYNRSITANGLSSLSPLLRAEHNTLCTLSLYGIIGDDEAVVLAKGLIGN